MAISVLQTFEKNNVRIVNRQLLHASEMFAFNMAHWFRLSVQNSCEIKTRPCFAPPAKKTAV